MFSKMKKFIVSLCSRVSDWWNGLTWATRDSLWTWGVILSVIFGMIFIVYIIFKCDQYQTKEYYKDHSYIIYDHCIKMKDDQNMMNVVCFINGERMTFETSEFCSYKDPDRFDILSPSTHKHVVLVNVPCQTVVGD